MIFKKCRGCLVTFYNHEKSFVIPLSLTLTTVQRAICNKCGGGGLVVAHLSAFILAFQFGPNCIRANTHAYLAVLELTFFFFFFVLPPKEEPAMTEAETLSGEGEKGPSMAGVGMLSKSFIKVFE